MGFEAVFKPGHENGSRIMGELPEFVVPENEKDTWNHATGLSGYTITVGLFDHTNP